MGLYTVLRPVQAMATDWPERPSKVSPSADKHNKNKHNVAARALLGNNAGA